MSTLIGRICNWYRVQNCCNCLSRCRSLSNCELLWDFLVSPNSPTPALSLSLAPLDSCFYIFIADTAKWFGNNIFPAHFPCSTSSSSTSSSNKWQLRLQPTRKHVLSLLQQLTLARLPLTPRLAPLHLSVVLVVAGFDCRRIAICANRTEHQRQIIIISSSGFYFLFCCRDVLPQLGYALRAFDVFLVLGEALA